MVVSTVSIVITISTVITAALAETEDDVYDHLDHQLDEVLDNHVSHLFGTQACMCVFGSIPRDGEISFLKIHFNNFLMFSIRNILTTLGYLQYVTHA